MIIKFLLSIKALALEHKIITMVVLLCLVASGYFAYSGLTSTAGETRYLLGVAKKATVIDSVSGTGQVVASNQIDLTSKIAGTISSIPTTEGSTVVAGQVIARLDATLPQKAVRDAETNLQTAKLSLEKLKMSADALSVLQAENGLAQAKESKQKAEDDLKKAYEDGFNTVTNAFLDLSSTMVGLQDILYGNNFDPSQSNLDYYSNAVAVESTDEKKVRQYKVDVNNTYQIARKAYDQNFTDYKSTSRFSDKATIEKMIDQTYVTTKNISEAVKISNNFMQFYQDRLIARNLKPNPLSDTHLLSLNIYTGKINTDLLNLIAIKRTIQTSKESIINADRTISEKTEALAKLKAGAIPVDVQSAELAVKQRENALLDAQQLFADYAIRAPFKGTIGKIDVKPFSNVAVGTLVGTLITKQLTARVVLNEVVAAKVSVGDKATLTFDALDGLSQTGTVAQIDTIGTVAQGVVSYAVKIAFDTQDEHVKPSMSTSAVIVTRVREDVLTVPNSAVKSKGATQYVQIFVVPLVEAPDGKGALSGVPPQDRQVEVGLSDDTNTEILSGIKEGDQVVVQTITADTQPQEQTSQAPSLIPAGGGGP